MLSGIGRCDPWKLLFYLQILLLVSYCVIRAVNFMGCRVNFGGSLLLEHPSGAPFTWQWKQQCGLTVLWADISEPVLFEAPGSPAWQCEERVQWAAECLGTCYSTLPAHTAEALGLRRTKLVMRLEETEVSLPCAGGPCYFIDLCVCYSPSNRSSWVFSLC